MKTTKDTASLKAQPKMKKLKLTDHHQRGRQYSVTFPPDIRPFLGVLGIGLFVTTPFSFTKFIDVIRQIQKRMDEHNLPYTVSGIGLGSSMLLLDENELLDDWVTFDQPQRLVAYCIRKFPTSDELAFQAIRFLKQIDGLRDVPNTALVNTLVFKSQQLLSRCTHAVDQIPNEVWKVIITPRIPFQEVSCVLF